MFEMDLDDYIQLVEKFSLEDSFPLFQEQHVNNENFKLSLKQHQNTYNLSETTYESRTVRMMIHRFSTLPGSLLLYSLLESLKDEDISSDFLLFSSNFLTSDAFLTVAQRYKKIHNTSCIFEDRTEQLNFLNSLVNFGAIRSWPALKHEGIQTDLSLSYTEITRLSENIGMSITLSEWEGNNTSYLFDFLDDISVGCDNFWEGFFGGMSKHPYSLETLSEHLSSEQRDKLIRSVGSHYILSLNKDKHPKLYNCLMQRELLLETRDSSLVKPSAKQVKM